MDSIIEISKTTAPAVPISALKRANENREDQEPPPSTRRKVTFSNPTETVASIPPYPSAAALLSPIIELSSSIPQESIIVSGAGLDAINGEYTRRAQNFDDVGTYTKRGTWRRGREEEFTIFRCQISTLEKHWYISIVPKKSQPGTYSDIDFYSSPANPKLPHLPPSTGWVRAEEGKNQPPTLQIIRGGTGTTTGGVSPRRSVLLG
mmetsp:Transcript_1211/g.1635  ORF Transcript_1211/g.1635 Transcript_1211/m.1635 type:complete len:206 (-) Transcript_1211:55-672(-)